MVGLLLITHDALGEALLNTACGTYGCCPLSVEVMSVGIDSDPDERRAAARAAAGRLDQGQGVLVLSDLYGSTPGNIACSLLELERTRVVTGVNLPMLIRVLNYSTLDLDAIFAKAISGGRDGVVDCRRPDEGRVHHA